MERNSHGQYPSHQQQYHGNRQHHHQRNNDHRTPWSQNGMMPSYGPTNPPSGPPPYYPPNQANVGNEYYTQAQNEQKHIAHPQHYGGASVQPYANQQSFVPPGATNPTSAAPRQYGQSMNNTNVNAWAQQYNQIPPFSASGSAQPVNAAPPTSNVSAPGYNQYKMYPPPPPPPSTAAAVSNSYPNQNQGQNVGYPPQVHPYYAMHQQPPYYYQPNQLQQPPAVPPPLPPQPPLPPPSQEPSLSSPATNTESSSSSKSSKHNKRSRSRSPTSEFTASSSKDKREPAPPAAEEKEEKETKKAVPIMVGKRRGGRVLPTGVVKKQKVEDDNAKGKSDAWSQYMAEVRRYKDQSCTEERQNRPLVK